MKYLLIIFDGMADEPIDELDGATPMQVAKTPFMDQLAEQGRVGVVYTTPEEMQPGSDITNMNILGYDPQEFYTGRAPLEAASLEIPLDPKDVAFRCNLVSTDGKLMLDSSAGHISTEEARILIDLVSEKLSTQFIRFYPGMSYRHIMVWRDGSDNVHTTAPYKFVGKPFADYLPEGDGEEKLRELILDSYEILSEHVINQRRIDEDHQPANMIWFWGEGRQPDIPSFFSRYGLKASVVAAVDLIRGFGRMVGMRVIDVPGATGYIDTNYAGKGQYALAALQDSDFVWVHVEAADEAGHEQKLDKKIEAIERMDAETLGTIMHGLEKTREDVRILLLPDHPTPLATGGHTSNPVPFVLYDSTNKQRNSLPFDENAVEESEFRIEEGHRLIDLLLE